MRSGGAEPPLNLAGVWVLSQVGVAGTTRLIYASKEIQGPKTSLSGVRSETLVVEKKVASVVLPGQALLHFVHVVSLPKLCARSYLLVLPSTLSRIYRPHPEPDIQARHLCQGPQPRKPAGMKPGAFRRRDSGGRDPEPVRRGLFGQERVFSGQASQSHSFVPILRVELTREAQLEVALSFVHTAIKTTSFAPGPIKERPGCNGVTLGPMPRSTPDVDVRSLAEEY